MNMENVRVLLTGGGTGGHVFPLVAVARALKKKGAEVAFIGPKEFSLEVLKKEGVKIKIITSAGKLRRYFSLKTIGEVLRLPLAFFQSLSFVRAWGPNIVLGKGGYGSIMPVLAARVLKIPVVIHESDIVPGLANRFLARFADKVAVSFRETKRYFFKNPVVVTGNPVRLKFLTLEKQEAKKILNFETRRQVIFIIGGSQGSVFLNRLLASALPRLLEHYAVIISSGQGNKGVFNKFKDKKNFLLSLFFNEQELAAAYVLANIVITRGGAGSIFELAAFGKPSVIIPLASSAQNHQLKNARVYEQGGAAIVLEEKDIDSRTLIFSIEAILKKEKVKNFMAEKAKEFARPNTADNIAEILIAISSNIFWSKVTRL